MKHRERVLMSLNHEQPDRCPMQISFTPEFAERLRKAREHLLPDAITTRTAAAIPTSWSGHSVRTCSSPPSDGPTATMPTRLSTPGSDTYTDAWGITWRNSTYSTRFGDGFYTEMVGHPLEDVAPSPGYRAPDPEAPGCIRRHEWVLRHFQGRILDRRGDGHDDLRDRLGAAGLRTAPHGFRLRPGHRRRHSRYPFPLPPARGRKARRAWAWT